MSMITKTKTMRLSTPVSEGKDFEAFLFSTNQSYKYIKTIKVESICPKILHIQKSSLIADLKRKGVNFSVVNLPTKKEIFTYLRSPFVHKKTKEQQIRKHPTFLIRMKDNEANTNITEENNEFVIPYNTKSCIMTFYYHGN